VPPWFSCHASARDASRTTWRGINRFLPKGVNTMASKIRPVGDRVVVRPAAKEEVTKSGIVIPDTVKEKPQEGVVVAVGSGKLLDNGDRIPLEIKEDDLVLYAKYGGTEFKLDGEDYLVLRESDVLAILVKE
jgi:chaperonin GroES